MLGKLFSDKFLRHNAIVLTGSLTAAFLNYLLHPMLSRLMTVHDFGEFQALLQIFNNLMFMGVFGTIVLNISANTDQSDEQALHENLKVISALKKVALIIALSVAAMVFVSSVWLKDFFNFDSAWPFVMLAPAPVIAMHGVFRKAYLRAQMRFAEWTFADVLSSLSRLVFAVSLVYLGFRALGAISGLVLSMFVGYTFIYLRSRQGFKYLPGIKVQLDDRLKREIRYGFLILSISLVMTAMGTADVLVVKHYFTPVTAGEYSAAATIARIIMYAAGPVAVVLTPNIKMRRLTGENRAMLRKAFRLTALIGCSVLLIFVCWPEFVLNLMMGDRYETAAHLLPYLAVLMLLVTFCNIFFAYHLALRHYFIALVGICGVSLSIGLSVLYHATPLAVVTNFIIGATAMLLMFMVRWVRRLFFYPKHESIA